MNTTALARRALVPLATFVSLVAFAAPTPSALAAVDNPRAAVPSVLDVGDADPVLDLGKLRYFRNFKGWQVAQLYSDTWSAGPGFNGLEVFYDTRGSSAPDYRVTMGFTNDDDNFEVFRLYRAAGKRWVTADCRNVKSKAPKDKGLIEIYVDRRCLKTTKKPGIRAVTWDFTKFKNGWPSRGISDTAPNTGWLR